MQHEQEKRGRVGMGLLPIPSKSKAATLYVLAAVGCPSSPRLPTWNNRSKNVLTLLKSWAPIWTNSQRPGLISARLRSSSQSPRSDWPPCSGIYCAEDLLVREQSVGLLSSLLLARSAYPDSDKVLIFHS